MNICPWPRRVQPNLWKIASDGTNTSFFNGKENLRGLKGTLVLVMDEVQRKEAVKNALRSLMVAVVDKRLKTKVQFLEICVTRYFK